MKLANILRHARNPRSWKRAFSHLRALPRQAMLAGKVEQQKAARAKETYNTQPEVAAILQFFNKRANIPMLWKGLQSGKFDEIIVLEDGSSDGSASDWQERLTHPNHFMIRSNDLFEIITYDRALRHSNAEFVCLLQDDDQLPEDDRWVRRAVELFRQFPDLMILGGFRAIDMLARSNGPVAEKMVLETEGDIERVAGLFAHRSRSFPMQQTPSGIDDFFFALGVVRAPVFIRRAAFVELGGFDLDFAPFLCDDIDNSIRAWEAGYSVGLYDVDLQRDLGLGGMRTFNSARMERQVRLNWEKIYQKHGQAIASGSIADKVDAANRAAREAGQEAGSGEA